MALVIEFVFLILFLGFFLFFLVQAYNMVFRGYAPFLATRSKIINKIIDKLVLKENSVVYELGAGRAGFLRAARKKYPKVKLIGIEYAWLPYLLGQIQNVLSNSKIIILKKNIFKVPLGEADIIYCYLNVDTMKRLEEVFKRECRPGAVVVSSQFKIPNKEASKMIESDDKRWRVHFYQY